ncbi:DUF4245 domain-containing protein [Mycetocola spongiae]|uniref:DUF4245 domain-containing protein n=1 Tax=Mycetocola spongiae TaxID=2859226 RepID=UPI001CF146D0|nr:DUF4245 domain-containing protein [Mycetocola spongiae]UCR89000.1 DUF4245 domain-containing protein [Mycetocola spongiae]
MAKKNSEPRVVAELGRPETAAETADRKATQSRNYRMRKTVNNLVFSLLVTVGLVAVIVLAVPRSTESLLKTVDYAEVASHAQDSVSQVLVTPELPTGWSSNYAEMRKKSSVTSWEIGFLTPKEEFIALAQGLDANDTWTAQLMKNTPASSVRTIDGIEWTIYDNRSSRAEVGNARYGMTTAAGASTYVLWGTAPTEEFDVLATALTPQIKNEATR